MEFEDDDAKSTGEFENIDDMLEDLRLEDENTT